MRSPLYVIEQGSKLAREGRRIVVSKDGATLAQVALLQVSQVIVFGKTANLRKGARIMNGNHHNTAAKEGRKRWDT